jgi:hypothetical protein
MLRSPEKSVADALIADPDVSALVGERVYPVIAPESASLPFLTWRRQAVQRESTLSGPAGMATVTLALEVYATTYYAARDLADRCRSKLDGWHTDVGSSVSVRHVGLVTESDGIVQLAGGDLPPVYSVTQTYTVLWQEI